MTRQYFIEWVDTLSGCAVSEYRINVPEQRDIRSYVKFDDDDLQLSGRYPLDNRDLDRILSLCEIDFRASDFEPHLVSWDPDCDLPYRLHAGRELPLMLSGEKPLSYFYEAEPPYPHFSLPSHLFDPYVEAGRFVKRDYVKNLMNKERLLPSGDRIPLRGMRVLLYALLHEAWRIDAFILLLSTAEKSGWCEQLTRMEGELLGYEDWQNDIFIERS